MKYFKSVLLYLFILAGLSSNAQTNYKPGYFINREGKRMNCFIRTDDLNRTPTSFFYKASQTSPVKMVKAAQVKRVEVTDGVAYEWQKIFTMPSDYRTELDDSLFLKLIVKGDAELYAFEGFEKTIFFFSKGTETSRLLPPPDSGSDEKRFVQILKDSLNCDNLIESDFTTLEYTSKKLMTLFIRYNVCKKTSYFKIETKKERDYFNVYLKPGISLRSLNIAYINNNNPYSTQYGVRPSFTFGLEGELMINHIKNQLSFLAGAEFISYSASENEGSVASKVDFSSVEIPIGLRQYLQLSPTSKVYLNVFYLVNLSFNSEVNFNSSEQQIHFDLNQYLFSYTAGLGYSYNNRWNAELRYYFPLEFFPREIYWQSNLSGVTLTIGYNLFK